MKLRIKELAKQKNITLTELAKRIDLSYVRLHAILNQSNTETATLEKIANALECELIELFEPESANLMHIYNRDTGEYLGLRKI